MTPDADDYFQKVGRSTATTLSSPGYTQGNTSINVGSTANWGDSTGVTFAIDEVDSDGARIAGTYNVFRGVVSSATQVSDLVYVGGDAHRDYTAGATTRVYITVSSYRENRMVDGLLVEHDQQGTHTDITADSLTVANNIDMADTKAIRDGNDNELIKMSQTASAVNEFTVKNAATGTAPQLQATGGDTNIDAAIVPKGTGAVTNGTQKIDWWQELGRTTLGVAGDTISVTGLPARKYLRIIIAVGNTGGTVRANIRFNNDTGNNYATRFSSLGGADGTSVSQSAIVTGGASALPQIYEVYVTNIAAQEKLPYITLVNSSTVGAGTAPNRVEGAAKWANTSDQITRVDAVNDGTGDFAIGSEVVVLGHD